MLNQDLKDIKKYYCENMMHLCRELFPSLLEQEGFLRDSDKKKIEKFYAPKYLKKISDEHKPKFLKELKLKNKHITLS